MGLCLCLVYASSDFCEYLWVITTTQPSHIYGIHNASRYTILASPSSMPWVRNNPNSLATSIELRSSAEI